MEGSCRYFANATCILLHEHKKRLLAISGERESITAYSTNLVEQRKQKIQCIASFLANASS